MSWHKLPHNEVNWWEILPFGLSIVSLAFSSIFSAPFTRSETAKTDRCVLPFSQPFKASSSASDPPSSSSSLAQVWFMLRISLPTSVAILWTQSPGDVRFSECSSRPLLKYPCERSYWKFIFNLCMYLHTKRQLRGQLMHKPQHKALWLWSVASWQT